MIHHKYLKVDTEFSFTHNLGLKTLELYFVCKQTYYFESKCRYYYEQFRMLGFPFTNFFHWSDSDYLVMTEELILNCNSVFFKFVEDSKGCIVDLRIIIDNRSFSVPSLKIDYYNMLIQNKLNGCI